MEEKKKNAAATEKVSYDKLKQMVSDLYQDNQRLASQLQQFDYTSFLLSMLFKVMDHSDKYSYDFTKWATKLIEDTLTSFVAAMTSPEEGKDEAK